MRKAFSLAEWILVTLFVYVAFLLASAIAKGDEPLPSFTINTGCIQTLNTQPALTIYTGKHVETTWQWGFAGGNVYTGSPMYKNGVGKTNYPFCSPALIELGDCWQSVTRMAGTPNAEKWIVAAGPSPQCHRPDDTNVLGLQVWKWNGTTFAWKGLIADTWIQRAGPFMHNPLLDGDMAYAVRHDNALLWDKFDLNAMTVVASSVTTPVTPPVQSNIGGFTYIFAPIFPAPPEGANRFLLTRVGSAATPTPAGTPEPTKTATRIPTWTRTPTTSPSRTRTAVPPTKTRTNTPVPPTPVPVTAIATPHIGPKPTASKTPAIQPRLTATQSASATPITKRTPTSWLPTGCRTKGSR